MFGAGTKSRTRDLRFTKPLLYQLSYAGFGGRIIRILNARGKGEFHGLKDGCHGPLTAWTSRRVSQLDRVLSITLDHLAGSLARR